MTEGTMIIDTIGKRIQEARFHKGWNKRQLARAAGVSYQWVVRVEAGDIEKPSAEYLERTAKALEIPLEDLTGTHEVHRRVRAVTLGNELTFAEQVEYRYPDMNSQQVVEMIDDFHKAPDVIKDSVMQILRAVAQSVERGTPLPELILKEEEDDKGKP